MVGRRQKALLLLMLLVLTGGQWAILQSVAWAGMLANRLRTERMSEAITTTFDGRHPCPLCNAVQAGRKSQSKSEVVVRIFRIEFPPIETTCLAVDADLSPLLNAASFDEFAESLAGYPMFHPPRPLFL